jgi:tetrahydromethanopterin S-methyltransferase subunit G
MADEPDNLTHVMLRKVMAKQDDHDKRFDEIDRQFDRLRGEIGSVGKTANLGLGRASRAEVDIADLTLRLDDLASKIEKLLSERPSN